MSDKQMVSVPRDELEAACQRFAKAQIFDFSRRMRALLAQPAEQLQGDPVAFRCVAPDCDLGAWHDYHEDSHGAALVDVQKGLLSRVELAYTRPAQGEPVGYLVQRVDPTGVPRLDRPLMTLCKPEEWGSAFRAQPLFTHADPSEVEQLRDALDECDGERWKLRTERDTLRAQLAERDALLKCWMTFPLAASSPEINEVRRKSDYILSASAKPSAPIAWHVGGNGYDRICFEKPDDLPGRPCVQAIHDQRQLIDLLKRYDLRDEDVPPDERGHGIPGTSFQRLNALANEGE